MKRYWWMCFPGILWADPLSMPSGNESESNLPSDPLANLSQSKEISCKDVLLNENAFTDTSVNLVFQHVFTLCTMELVMQRYIEFRKTLQKKDDELTIQTKDELTRLQKLLPTFLYALQTTITAFAKGNLREQLNTEIEEYRQKNALDGLAY